MKYYIILVDGKPYFRSLSENSYQIIDNIITAFHIVFDGSFIQWSEITKEEYEKTN